MTNRIPHTVRRQLPNVLDVSDLEADRERWLDELRDLDRAKEKAGVETPESVGSDADAD